MKTIKLFPDLKQFCEFLSDLVIFLKTDGTIYYCNQSFANFVGMKKEDIIEKKCYELVHSSQTFITNCPLVRSLESGKREYNEYEKKGQYFSVAVDPIRDEEGKIIGFIHIMRDFTDFMKIQNSLKESEEKHRAIVENAQEAIVVIQDGLIKFINPKGFQISGYSAEEILFKPFIDFLHPDDRQIAIELYKKMMTGEMDIKEAYPLRIFDKQGNIKWIEVNAIKINWEGKPAELSFIRDISEIKKAEQEKREMLSQLVRYQKIEAVRRLISGLTHELANILTLIKGFAQLTYSSLEKEDIRANYQRSILESSEKAEKLISRLATLGREPQHDIKPINLNEYIMSMQDEIRKYLGDDIFLSLNLAPDLGLTKTDPIQLETILMSLIANSREAMPKGGVIQIETSNFDVDKQFVENHIGAKLGSYVKLSVKDTGIGISDEIKDKVFEPFFSTKEDSIGLGLSTVYAIVKQNDGYIWFETEVGKGTTFNVILPRIVQEGEKQFKIESRLKKGEETILIIDDNELVRVTLREILKKLGYKVLEAQSHDIALFFAQFYPKTIDLMICDVVMPGISGVKLYGRVRRYRPDMKVLYMSGYPDDVLLKHGLDIDKVDFIRKPFIIEELSKKIREVLDRQQ